VATGKYTLEVLIKNKNGQLRQLLEVENF